MSRWLRCFPPRPDAVVRLVCVPGAGCSASMFHGWSRELPDQVEVCAVQPPGRGARLREEPLTRMEPYADGLAAAVAADPGPPVVVLGHSLGALIAFETAARLARDPATTPLALVVAAHRAPARGNAGFAGHRLPEAEVLAVATGLGGPAAGGLAEPAVRRTAIRSLRADFELDHHYRYRHPAPLPVPITVYGGDADPAVPPADLEGWRAHTGGAFRTRVFPGGHFVQDGPARAGLFADLSALLLDHVRPLRSTR
ncbi:alpha/beta fold hydrolase [Amycolatopsis sp. PS_44_ISF1]|uniref:thioesterase II family protein n=1 Tax=Amycolatopsis sp. PS_44_ISF1 TaxID=2974917 RepID=UPI0028DD80C8|nr:alpha/beta fold hydrolase [Amycolatopsis sp. PS_44_ISF1]MDT8913185.1 alpha/beta fold hydrolase [Amycolatopsis sp. PS_44_ISF1]